MRWLSGEDYDELAEPCAFLIGIWIGIGVCSGGLFRLFFFNRFGCGFDSKVVL